MIILFHQNNIVKQIINAETNADIEIGSNSIQKTLIKLCQHFENEVIVWCRYELKDFLNLIEIENQMSHNRKMISFETSENFFLNSDIEYVEQTPFINVKKNVIYPTWLMSSDIGVVHADVLLKFEGLINYKLSFDQFLNYISKRAMQLGIFCYSNPFLLKKGYPIIPKPLISTTNFIQFIKSNYRYRWIWLYLFNKLMCERKLLIMPFLKSLFKRKVEFTTNIYFKNVSQSSKKKQKSIDVVIPTLERDEYLYKVLNDLKLQTLLPNRVIIIEQKDKKDSPSTLDFLKEQWPFDVSHTLIYDLGACNARNIALEQLKNEWVFFADDDIRLQPNFFEKSFDYIEHLNADAITVSCLQENQQESITNLLQWSGFGSGCSIVKSTALNNIKFDITYEHGYGEDGDFGMQLRNKGVDVFYVPFVHLKHLKAPIGGFRKPNKFLWSNEELKPKPSPTVMVFNLKHKTKKQLNSYRTTLFFKFYKSQNIKNPIKYYNSFKKSWSLSKYWARELMNTNAN